MIEFLQRKLTFACFPPENEKFLLRLNKVKSEERK